MAKVEILQQKGYNFLWINDELWMWDVPEEVKDQQEIAEKAYGDVLVAGYGLGLVQEFLLENNRVESVLSVELLEDVIKQCKKVYGRAYGEVEICDFFDYQTEKRFDCVIGDIWLDHSREYLDDYKRFKSKAQTLLKENGKILAWGMDYLEYLLRKE